MCVPKSEGGWLTGILLQYLRHIWNIFARVGSLWIHAWVKECLLKD
jgi:hypothetical protein